MYGMTHLKPIKTTWARAHRTRPTRAEAILWRALRKGQLDGCHFRQQAPLFGYIVDFYCARRQLVVEVDGPYHFTPEQRDRDDERDARLRHRASVTILRFSNDLILNHLPSVLKAIRAAAWAPKPPRRRTSRQ